jgi:ABC-type lipoprotein release transport system permease subunit
MAFVMGERLFFKFHLSDLITSVCILFLFPLAAALIPAWRASSIKPAQALRTE